MLYSYKIQNFLPFKLKEELNFNARPYKDHKKHLINNSILPIIVIYGPNGGGKSSILKSIIMLRDIVMMGNNIINIIPNLESFINKNDDNKNKIISWEIQFLDDSNFIYTYFLEINTEDKNIKNEVLTKEDFNNKTKPKVIFNREKNEFCKELKDKNIIFDNVFGSYLYYLNSITIYDDISVIIKEFKKIIFFEGTKPQYWNSFNNPIFPLQTTLDFEFIQRNKDTYLTIFKELDINIKDILFTKLNNFDYKVEVIKNDNFKHEIKIPLFFESKGTIKLIDIITIILKEMHNNSIFIIDELDSSLHTKLLEYIIKIFVSNKKNNSSQLIYTSHDMGTLTNKLFRKDEIYFAAINESYFSNIVSLADFDLQIRKTNSFSKLYMEGKLGYDPYIDYSLEWINGKKK